MDEDGLRAVTVGEPQPLAGRIEIVDYDPIWPALFAREAARIRSLLADRLLAIEHVGSASVPGLAAKPRRVIPPSRSGSPRWCEYHVQPAIADTTQCGSRGVTAHHSISRRTPRFVVDRTARFDHVLAMRMSVVVGMVLCAGCGGSHATAQQDAGGEPPRDAMADAMADAGVDAAPDAMPDARDPTVRVRFPPDFASSGYEIRFYSPSNQLLTIVQGIGGGFVSVAMPDGGTVIMTPDPVALDLDGMRVLFGVKPGDDIKLFPLFEEPNAIGEMSITVPPKDGTAVYRADTRCGGGSSRTTTITAFVDLACQPPLTVVVHAEDASGAVIGALRGTSSSTTSATLGGQFVAPDVFSLQVANDDRASPIEAVLTPVVEGHSLNQLNQSRMQSLAAGETATISFATAPAAMVDARTLDIFMGGQHYQRVRAATESTFVFDRRVEALPSYVFRQYDPLQRKLTLSPLANAVAAGIDGQIAEFTFNNDPLPFVRWRLVIPPDVTEVVMPENPDPRLLSDARLQLLTATAIRASSYNGYDDFRCGVPVTSPIGSYHDETSL